MDTRIADDYSAILLSIRYPCIHPLSASLDLPNGPGRSRLVAGCASVMCVSECIHPLSTRIADGYTLRRTLSRHNLPHPGAPNEHFLCTRHATYMYFVAPATYLAAPTRHATSPYPALVRTDCPCNLD